MTAEVAILNKGAVALAADSKVSIGGSRPEKTYDTQNKIFTLSKVHPIGILIYNNADFMEYPWETIIKLYRSQKKAKAENTVEAWAADFIKFLKRFGNIKKADITKNVSDVLSSTFEQIEYSAIFSALRQGVPTTSPKYEGILVEILEDAISELKQFGRLFSTARSISVMRTYQREMLDVIANFVPRAGNKQLVDLAIEFGSRSLIADYFSPASTGLVIAGFGVREIFPSSVHYSVDGYIGPQIKISKPNITTVTKTMTGSVAAYAQNDIVHRFMEGIDPDYSEYLRTAVSHAMIEGNLKVFEKWAPQAKKNDKTRRAVRRAAERQFTKMHDAAIRYRQDEFWHPTVQMVALLPKDELADLAESLVEITSLHRRVSSQMETVGGPIDVAVISKSDGFVWVKRKHYFEADRNPQFVHNYMREIGEKR